MHCPSPIFNERHGEVLFCRSERAKLFSAALKRGIRILRQAWDNGTRRCWVAHAKIHTALFPTQSDSAHGHQDSLAICYLVVSSVFSYCPRMHKEREAEIVHCISALRAFP